MFQRSRSAGVMRMPDWSSADEDASPAPPASTSPTGPSGPPAALAAFEIVSAAVQATSPQLRISIPHWVRLQRHAALPSRIGRYHHDVTTAFINGTCDETCLFIAELRNGLEKCTI